MSRTRLWGLGTAALILVIFVAGWFLAVSPKRAAVADLRAQEAEATQQANSLQTQIDVLKAQAAELPRQRQRLRAFATKFPRSVQLPTLIRNLNGLAVKSGVTVTTLSPSIPEAPAAATESGTAPPPTAADSTYLLVPLSLTVTGSYSQLERFLDAMESLPRSLATTSVSIGKADQSSAGSATLQAMIEGNAFVVTTPATTPAAPSGAGASS